MTSELRKAAQQALEALEEHGNPYQGHTSAYRAAITALHQALAEPEQPDDVAVDRFAQAMKDKMAKQRAKGYSGWQDSSDCPAERLQQMLVDHIPKGDPVDVGNFAMMLWNRGDKTNFVAPEPWGWAIANRERTHVWARCRVQKPYWRDSSQHFEPFTEHDLEACRARWPVHARDLGMVTLYTAPPPRKWAGLTDDEMTALLEAIHPENRWTLMECVEFKLKEKNT